MKSANTNLINSIRRDYAVNAVPKLTADWNHNYYYTPTADNIPSEESEGFDVEMFPIESIYGANRPTKGIAKARVNQAIVSNDIAQGNVTRFYLGSVDDTYKYWTSPVTTDNHGVFPLHTDGDTKVKPYVIYTAPAPTNKIVIKLENSWATPLLYDIRTQSTVGGAWTTIATTPTIRNDGQIIIYWNGTGWSSTKPATLTSLQNVAGIQFRVYSLTSGRKTDGTIQTYDTYGNPPTYAEQYDSSGHLIPVDYTTAGAYTRHNTNGILSNFDLIAIEAHLEADLTSYLIETSCSESTGDASYLYPIGTINSNTGSVKLSNVDGIFNKDNPISPYKNILEGNTKFTLEYIYTVNGVKYTVQGFTMYGGPWEGQDQDEVDVTVDDPSKYLDVAVPKAALWENLTVPQIMWKILDSVGFVDYNITVDDRADAHTIPIFWLDGEKTAWAALDELAQASQSAIFFDEYSILQIRTRDAAFDNTETPVWTLRGENSGVELADIQEFEQTAEFEANNVTITYDKTDWSDWNNGQPSLQTVWQPDGTITLRAAQLTSPIANDTELIWLTPRNAEVWPWSGKVNIESEIISYEGKQYVWYSGTTASPVRHWTTVKTLDEKKAKDTQSGDLAWKNHYTGGLKITERGVWNSEKINHNINSSGYNVRTINNGNHRTNASGFQMNKYPSAVRMTNSRSVGAKSANDIMIATRGAEVDFPPRMYGAKFKFTNANMADQQAGIVILNNATTESGLYINITPTLKLNKKDREWRDEIVLYSRHHGKHHKLATAKQAIIKDKWIELDVYASLFNDKQHIKIYVNGVTALTVDVRGDDMQPESGEYGMYIGGRTQALFEYFYSISRPVTEPEDDVSFFDMIQSGYTGAMWDREWTYNWGTRTRRIKKKNVKEQSRFNQKLFDDFGPWVHEIREFDVKFDPNPVLHSRLFSTDEWNAVVLEYRANPFGAKWIMANASRGLAVINGDDALSFDGITTNDTSVAQQMVVFGRPLIVADDATIVAKDDVAIEKRGKVDTELTSTWLQSEAMAQAVADWIVKHWSQGVDEVSATIFGNPLLQLTDVVSVDYPRKGMAPETHKYFVVGIETGFSQGVTTTLTLRRVRETS